MLAHRTVISSVYTQQSVAQSYSDRLQRRARSHFTSESGYRRSFRRYILGEDQVSYVIFYQDLIILILYPLAGLTGSIGLAESIPFDKKTLLLHDI